MNQAERSSRWRGAARRTSFGSRTGPPHATVPELLFDLVFVFALARVSDLLVAGLNSPPPTIDEYGKSLLLLLALLMVWFLTA